MLLSKLNSLFVWENLPNTISTDFLNVNLFLNGFTAFFKKDDKLYTNFGGLGGKPNSEYEPTQFILSNPILGTENFIINSEDENCIIMYNTEADKQLLNYADSGGLYNLIHQTAVLLTDNITSINCNQINTRVQTIVTAENETQRLTAEKYLENLYKGKPYQVLVSDELQKITVNNVDTGTNQLQQLLELHQFIIASFYNNIGITTTPYNKRERLITDEINSIDCMTECTIDTMLKARQTAVEKINKLFGVNIKVRKADFLEMKKAEEEKENVSDNGKPISKESDTV